MIRTTIVLLAACTAVAGSAAAQAAEPVQAPPSAVDAEPLSVGTALRSPRLVDGLPLRVEGVVVRTARRQVAGASTQSLLIRDAAGDTLPVAGAEALPVVGTRVVVTGTLRAGPGERVELVDGAEPLRVEVVWAPPTDAADRAESGPTAAGVLADWCGRLPAPLQATACSRAGLAVLLAAVLLLVAAGALALLWRLRSNEESQDIPLIVDLGSRDDRDTETVPGTPVIAASAPSPTGGGAPARAGAQPEAQPAVPDTAAPAGSAAASLEQRVRAAAARRPLLPATGPAALAEVVMRHGARPPPPTGAEVLQILPGRLEVVEGEALGPELRFFRLSSREMPEITFGRDGGPRHRHVELPASSVNGLHACLRFRGEFWTIASLSAADPVAVNDEPLGEPDRERTLRDGDRIRIGEYVFRFRAGRG